MKNILYNYFYLPHIFRRVLLINTKKSEEKRGKLFGLVEEDSLNFEGFDAIIVVKRKHFLKL